MRAPRRARRAGRPTSRASGPQRATSGTPVGSGTAGSAAADEVVHARGPVDDVGVVGGGHDRTAGRPVGRDEPDDGGPGAAVLADGRLVGEQHRRAVVQCRGHGEAPLLPTGELSRVGRLEVAQAQGGEQGAGPVGRTAASGRRPSAPCAGPTVRAVASTSSSTVRATIVELDHCGTQASVRARSGGGQRRRAARHPPVAGRAPARRPGDGGRT